MIDDVGSTVTTRLQLFFRDTSVSSGTGFFYKHSDQLFLITCWHIVSGRHFQTEGVLSSKGAVPDRVKFAVMLHGPEGTRVTITRELYEDVGSRALPQKPIWLEHPDHHHKVDVVAIPIQIPADAEVRTIDAVNTEPKMLLFYMVLSLASLVCKILYNRLSAIPRRAGSGRPAGMYKAPPTEYAR